MFRSDDSNPSSSPRAALTRRSALRSAAATAMLGPLFKATAGQASAQTSVNKLSAPSTLKITDMRTCRVAANYDYPIIKIYTNQGVYGLGEVRDAGVEGIALVDLGSDFPGRSSFGARWNHIGSGYELSASFYDGFNYLPDLQGTFNPLANAIEFVRTYPELRLYGVDAAVPLRWFTIKTEAAYYTSPDREQDEYVIYVVQLERQTKELSIVAGYAGDAITARTPTLQFSPELGFARAVLAHAQYTIDSNRSVAVDTAVRQNGRGSWLRAEYSQAFGQHWRATGGYSWIRGDDGDFLGQYHRNSFALLALRYSF